MTDHRYLRVARVLRKEIADGVYPIGSQLPTEHELCERFNVSRYTVREALRRLREDNLVVSRPRSGTVVVPRAAANCYAQEVVSIDDLVAFAAGAHFEIDSNAMVTLDSEAAARTGLAPGTQWLAVRGNRRTEDQAVPICHTEYYINRTFAGVGRLLQRHTGPIFPLIEDVFGVSVVEVRQHIRAVIITPELSTALAVAPGTAGLQMQRRYTTSEGEIAQVTVNTHAGDDYRYSMTLHRVTGPSGP
ncbi:GntR family transcriptional regulator [Mycolicibacter engbaekii]|uniref:GntR family transcriptional regulator n=1 Tax=Mycolicibacter engbaekii TaxID=188915 RepID=A0A1X1TZK2_9MYCO|nr:GntR family transcriptional regulator [Mycolicibacter engbaekii]ORV50012.1 GntR family transcriptional regulator [Mycolicibacter engbaekii]